jgi:putative nucleotidyltransferase with HDIG domain
MEDGVPDTDGEDPRSGARPPDMQALLDDIEHSLERFNLGFDIAALDVLDNETSRPHEIEALKDCLGEPVTLRLFSIANSNYYGKLRSGRITRFIDVVKHLGADTTRSMAIFIALLSRADNPELKEILARSFATAKLAEIFADRLGMKAADRSLVGLAGLFVDIGKIVIRLHANERRLTPDPDFIEHYHTLVGGMVIRKFELPERLADLIGNPELAFAGQDGLAPSAVVSLAQAVTERSFARHGRLVVESAMPDPEQLLYTHTLGTMLAAQFQAAGLAEWLCVIASEMTPQEQYLYEKRKRELL